MLIELELHEVNLILNALAKLPYEDVAPTILNIKEQINA